MIFLLYATLWYAIGVASFIYWWTNELDFTSSNIPLAMIIGFAGPLAFPIGFLIHGNHSESRTNTILKKRTK